MEIHGDNTCISNIEYVMNAHEILRTVFAVSKDGTMYQVIHNDSKPHLTFIDSDYSQIADIVAKDRDIGFSIGDRYWIRFTVIQCTNRQYMLITLHHALYEL